MAVIVWDIMKGRQIVIPEVLKQQVLDHLHINHMGIEKTKLVVGADTFTINNNNYLYIVDYLSKFPIIKKAKIFQLTA